MPSHRENLLRTLRRQGYEFVPIDMELCASQKEVLKAKSGGSEDTASYFGFSHRSLWLGTSRTFDDGAKLYRNEVLPPDARVDDWGVGHSKGSAAALHMTRMHHPLKGDISLDQLREFPYPRIKTEALGELTERVAAVNNAGLAACGTMACTIWETAWYMRSMEDLMTDMMLGDEKAAYHLDRVTECSRIRAECYARAGVDMIMLGDDIGTQRGPMVSVEMWTDWLKPRLKRVIDSARAIKPDLLVWYHSCGNVTEFLDGLIEAGVDILNPVQPECMDFEEVHEHTRGRLSFWGTIGTQHTLPFGTPADVKAEVRSRLDRCGDAGGIVIAPTHLVEPEVPWENIVAMVEAAREYTS